ncbi:TPA: RepB family plasmid replication initiator protein, partial [Staphylococcus aureus]
RQYINREKTPKWLEERTYEKQPQNKYDPQLESKREAFQRRLKEKWGDN